MSRHQPTTEHLQPGAGRLHTSTPTLSYLTLPELGQSTAQSGSCWYDRDEARQESARDTIESLPSISGCDHNIPNGESMDQTSLDLQYRERVLHLLLNAERLAFQQTPISQCFWEAFFTRYIQEWLHGNELYLYQLPVQLKHDYQFSPARLHAFFGALTRLYAQTDLSLRMHIPAEYLEQRAEVAAITTKARRRKSHEDPTAELLTIHAKMRRTPPPSMRMAMKAASEPELNAPTHRPLLTKV